MAFSSPPSTPDRPIQPSVRRAFTAPTKLARNSSLGAEPQTPDSETLFAHDTAKIVAFTATDASGRQLPTIYDRSKGEIEQPVGVLPWGSWTERTVAAGPLRIYRVINSVTFLHSGNVVQPLLAKSQCWCVDGVSKFVMRIREMNYYRIELPCNSTHDEAQIDLFKGVLDGILQYEKKPCPFKRSFTVELPDPPETPIKKVPWRPKTQYRVASANSIMSPPPSDNYGSGDAHRGFRHSNLGSPVAQAESPPEKVADFPYGQSEGSSSSDNQQEGDSQNKFDSRRLGLRKFSEIKQRLDSPANANQIRPGEGDERPVLEPISIGTADIRPNTPGDSDLEPASVSTESVHSSPESFYSTMSSGDCRSQSFVSNDSPLSSNEVDCVENCLRPTSSRSWDLSDSTSLAIVGRAGSFPSTRTIGPSIETCKPGLRVRREWEKRRMISPMPSSSNLASPFPPSQRQYNEITNTLLQRTCFYLIKPPLYLLTLMIKVAIQITRGSLQGSMEGAGDHGQRIPCSWDFSSDDDDAGNGSWDEDDYGFTLGRTTSGRTFSSRSSGTWDND